MLVAVTSVKGSPGVTTFALALAAWWPAPHWSLLVEADPSGGDVAWRFSLDGSPGLLGLVAASRRDADPRLPWRHAQALPGDLPVVASPADAGRCSRALAELLDGDASGLELLRSAGRAPATSVIVDCGRLYETSPVVPIVRAADAVLVLSEARSDALAHLVEAFPLVEHWNSASRLVLVGPGHTAAEVERELRTTPLGHVPADPHGAAVLAGERDDSRRTRRVWRRSGIGTSVEEIARQVAAMPVASVRVEGGPSAPEPSRSAWPPSTGGPGRDWSRR